MSLPTIVYRSPGPFSGPPVDGESTTFATLGVSTPEALAAALAAGWCRTLPEAVAPAPKQPEPAPDPAPSESPSLDDPAALKEAIAAAEARAEENRPDLHAMDRDDLKSLAESMGLDFDGRLGKDKLITLIEAARGE